MKELFSHYFSKKIIIVITLLISFLIGFLVTNTYNFYHSYYVCSFEVSDITNFEYNKLNDNNYLASIRDSASKYENIDINKMLSKKEFKLDVDGNKITITTKSMYYDTFFNSKIKNVDSRAKMFIKDSIKGITKEENTITYLNENIIDLYGDANRYIVGLYAMLIGGVICLSTITVLYYKKKEFIIEESKIDLFKKEYWRGAISFTKEIRAITNIAMLFALMLVCKFIKIPSGFSNLGLSFTYLFFSIVAMIYGPICGFIVGIFSDIIGYFMIPDGIFFPLYTLQAALTGFIYGICLYKQKITFSKVLLARTLVNMLMNVIFGSICYGLLYSYDASTTISYMLYLSLPKNLIYLLPQSLLLYFVIRLVSPILIRFKLIGKQL